MNHRIAIDFGTTNSVVAHQSADTAQVEIVAVPGLAEDGHNGHPPLIPSLLYVQDGKVGRVVAGQAVRDNDLDSQRDNRLFRNFKRGIVAAPAPEPREIDSAQWADADAGRSFLRSLIGSLPYNKAEIEQMVLTVPVVSFEGYLTWLTGAVDDIAPDKIRVVDESTAAALGYTVTQPGALVLVLDFGGGSLDLSLVQLPESREKTGGFLNRLLKSGADQHTARVIAKAGRVIGGSDIDQWLLAEALRRTGLSPTGLGKDYAALLTLCEQAKIALSLEETSHLEFEVAGKSHQITVTRAELESMLEDNGYFAALRHVIDKIMHIARRRGIFRENIHYVLMVGGTSLMPSVQRTLGEYFDETTVHAHKPFTAVAEGALEVAAGSGLEDYLVHSYGLRHLDPDTGEHQYEEIVPMGSAYPTQRPTEVTLSAAHEKQETVEFVIGEIDTEAVDMVEVKYEDGQAVFVAQSGGDTRQQIIPLNTDEALQALAPLDPPAKLGKDRLKARFRVDQHRQLRVTVIDLKTKKQLLNDVVLTTLR
jgi:molecular chaperone DnaK (HSP70)